MTELTLYRLGAALALSTILTLPGTGLARQTAADGEVAPEGTAEIGSAVAEKEGPGNRAATCPFILDLGAGELTGPTAEYARASELTGKAPLRSRLFRRTSTEARLELCASGTDLPWNRGLRPNLPGEARKIEVIFPSVSMIKNTGFPDDRNNGALWAGRGSNVQVSAGVAFRHGRLSGAIIPGFYYQENLDFEIVTAMQPPGYSHFIHPWHPGRIDWPQRFGRDRFSSFDLGQSHLRYEDRGLALTLATENLWLGPAQRYPLLLGNTAPGFAHIAFGTARPHDIRIGALEARAFWGRLEESPWFDGDRTNDRRVIAGFSAELQPWALPGLYLGFTRIHVVPSAGLSFGRKFIAPFFEVGGDDGTLTDHPGYRLLGLSGRWVFPEAGFEFYGEWATRAHWSGIRDFLREPGRGQAFMVGFQHVSAAGRRWVRTYGELVQLGGSAHLPQYGGPISFYTDPRVPQGHTHRGQLLGTSIGPGSDAQILGIDLITGWTTIGVFAERIRRDEDSYFTYWTRYYGRDAHDVALRAGIRQTLFFGPFSLGWELVSEDRRNRTFLRLDGANWDLLREHNHAFQASVGWRPGSGRHSFRPPIIFARQNRD